MTDSIHIAIGIMLAFGGIVALYVIAPALLVVAMVAVAYYRIKTETPVQRAHRLADELSKKYGGR
jgi:hypothetical protein